jgi:hypothetical protein
MYILAGFRSARFSRCGLPLLLLGMEHGLFHDVESGEKGVAMDR